MALDNIQKSELVIAKILALLMEWGVNSTQLKFEELELDDEYVSYFIPCINWLVAESVIRTGSIKQFTSLDGIVMNPVLSSYGMRILGLEVSLDGNSMTLAKAVKDVQSGERLYSQLGNFSGGFLGSLIKSVSS
ncbi:MAG: hypothetical protein GQ535_05815 [Rhodobacteraceae bacterium]|nr:hypothetical protein [Paracoccaceae bacterium]